MSIQAVIFDMYETLVTSFVRHCITAPRSPKIWDFSRRNFCPDGGPRRS